MTPTNPFLLLGTTPKFDLDLPFLEKTYREIARALHPDKFQAAPPSQRLAALSRAVELNDAWRTLQDPVKRAEALFALHGVATGTANEPKAAPGFLMEMMEAREALSLARDANNIAEVRTLADEAGNKLKTCERRLASAFDTGDEAVIRQHAALLGEIRFHKRFLEEAEAVLFDAGDPTHDAV